MTKEKNILNIDLSDLTQGKKHDIGYKELTFKEIKSLDTIEVLEDLEKIDFPNENYKIKPFLSDDFVIKYILKQELGNKLFIEKIYAHIRENTINIYTYSVNNYTFNYMFTCILKENAEMTFYYKNGIKAKKNLEHLKSIISTVFDVMAYVSYTLENKNTVVKTERKNRTKEGKDNNITYKKKYNILNSDKVVYAISTNAEIKKAKYKRHIESWEVIGHKRTYKSGKVIWIPPCTKGQGKKKNKHYIVAN